MKDKENIILIGSGQHANVVLYNIEQQNKYNVIGILDIDISKKGSYLKNIPIIGSYECDLEELKEKLNTNKFFIGFGNMKYRKKVFELMIKNGWEAVNIIHPDAIVSKDSKLGKGILIECGCLITPNPIIGDNVVINTGSQVNHDNIIEDHVYIASGVVLSGGVTIGENTLLDDGVIVTLGRIVGKNCIIGAGAVVTKNIDECSKAVGIPAKPIEYFVIGAGGHGKVITDIINANNTHPGGVIINYFDDKLPLGTKLECGTVIGKIEDCCKYLDGLFVIAIGDNHTRKKIAEKYKLNYTSLIHSSAILGRGVTIGEGTVVMPNAVINANTAIGEHCIINTGAVIEHDNIIEDYVHISPNCSIGGTVKIGQCTHIGIGATVKNNITIKENIIIGAGAVAITDISESGIYVGVPARRI